MKLGKKEKRKQMYIIMQMLKNLIRKKSRLAKLHKTKR